MRSKSQRLQCISNVSRQGRKMAVALLQCQHCSVKLYCSSSSVLVFTLFHRPQRFARTVLKKRQRSKRGSRAIISNIYTCIYTCVYIYIYMHIYIMNGGPKCDLFRKLTAVVIRGDSDDFRFQSSALQNNAIPSQQ